MKVLTLPLVPPPLVIEAGELKQQLNKLKAENEELRSDVQLLEAHCNQPHFKSLDSSIFKEELILTEHLPLLFDCTILPIRDNANTYALSKYQFNRHNFSAVVQIDTSELNSKYSCTIIDSLSHPGYIGMPLSNALELLEKKKLVDTEIQTNN